MIKLTQLPAPTSLTPQRVQELTADYIADNSKTVWKGNGIEQQLLSTSNNKCCYCECDTNSESKYMEVEHFKPKDLYPNDIVLWSNLLPCCKRCNTTKGAHDVIAEPIINPYVDNPQEHLCFRAYRFYGNHTSTKGRMTIDSIRLNDSIRLTPERFKVGEKINESLIDLKDITLSYTNGHNSTRTRNRINHKLEVLLIEATPQYAYAATAATVLLNNEDYSIIKKLFIDNNLWTDKFQQLENLAQSCALPLKA